MTSVRVRIRERDLMIPALRAAARRPDGCITTSDLIKELEDEFQPDGEDASILTNRSDSRFSQIVRNLAKSHKESRTSMYKRGYAVEHEDGFCITELGMAFFGSD